MQLAWKDTSLVLFLSTAFSGHEPCIIRLHKRSATASIKLMHPVFGDEYTKKIPIPAFIDAYNYHMNGVDIADQFRTDLNHNRHIRRGACKALVFDYLFGQYE